MLSIVKFSFWWIVGNLGMPLAAIPAGAGLARASRAALSFWVTVWDTVEDGELLVLSAGLMSATAYEVWGASKGLGTKWSVALILLTIVFISPFSVFKTANSAFPRMAPIWSVLIRFVSVVWLLATSSLLIWCRLAVRTE
jgi:hypothetical protein